MPNQSLDIFLLPHPLFINLGMQVIKTMYSGSGNAGEAFDASLVSYASNMCKEPLY